ncbi:hypothetical protein M408DRAFT_25638 [Serendipita vermifera MAFF 305830]|uniref:Uncharacterized protein n=1 Tax=Serendipita vermifera MAFF 305830 TaxID=933852 RepID=A0A0C3B420_SERVB|nr:hypothetical protein M408DRAFT_25638 [Serendipita vermifera MAFF 305830]
MTSLIFFATASLTYEQVSCDLDPTITSVLFSTAQCAHPLPGHQALRDSLDKSEASQSPAVLWRPRSPQLNARSPCADTSTA